MWIFTKYGFFSIVCAREGFGEPGQQVDPQRVIVRSRSREQLERLKNRFSELAALPIVSFPGADYPVRLFVEKTVWANIVRELADEMDYDNFKRMVMAAGKDLKYQRALHEVWEIMR
jgi:hypothetical protein